MQNQKAGTTRTLNYLEAVEQYIVLRSRAEEIARFDFLFQALKTNRMSPPAGSPFSAAELADAVRTAFLGWFTSLMDRGGQAIYAFNCLYRLFPYRERDIRKCEMSLEACAPELRLFRNNVAFHARKEITEHIRSRQAMRGDAFIQFVSAVREFRELQRTLEEEELTAIPELRSILEQFGVAHLPVFARSFARCQQQKPQPYSEDQVSCSLLPDSCEWLP
jgi:hypothetical protein